MNYELEKLYEHVDEIEIAMMTTRRDDGHLQSRAMATQKRAEGADLWFVTSEGTQKLRDVGARPIAAPPSPSRLSHGSSLPRSNDFGRRTPRPW